MERQHATTVTAERNDGLQPRMKNPAMFFPEAGQGIQALIAAVLEAGLPQRTLDLVHLRVSQINGCSTCVESASCGIRKAGETDERMFAVAAWRHSPHFSDAERSALALAESVTRLADRGDVPDDIWDEAARRYGEKALAGLLLWISLSNLFNRLNVSTRQVAITWN